MKLPKLSYEYQKRTAHCPAQFWCYLLWYGGTWFGVYTRNSPSIGLNVSIMDGCYWLSLALHVPYLTLTFTLPMSNSHWKVVYKNLFRTIENSPEFLYEVKKVDILDTIPSPSAN